jgi:glycosyltransferase involved in cell wall biosynthesis
MTRSVAIIGTRGYPSYYGGFETAVRKLAPFLANAGWEVSVYGRPGATSDRDASIDPRVKRITTRGIESKSLSTLSYGFTASLDALRKKPDVALVMNVANGYFLPALKARGIPTLVNVDGIEWDRAKWGRAAKAVFKTGASLTARFGTELVCDSTEIAERWSRDFGRNGLFIPYGGDVPELIPVEDGLTRRGYVLVVARFVPENTIGEFIEAAETLSTYQDVVIVGSSGYGGEIEDRVRRLAEGNPRVTWLGHVSDDHRLLGLWQNCGAYFHGHSVGGTNPALVQAMACGAPVVARDTVYNREVLGSDGLFVSPTASAIAEGLRKVLENSQLQSKLSVSAETRARHSYSWQLVNEKYERALNDLVLRGSADRRP